MPDVELKPHQVKAIEKMHNGCLLAGGVGVGKTITSLAYYVQHESPKPLYVITTAKKRNSLDWEGDAIKYGIGRLESLHGLITVDSWNNIEKYKDIRDAFFIFDEQRVVGTGAWTKAFIKIAKRNNWILLSATPGDNWLDYMPVFIANGFYQNMTEFKREHVQYAAWSKHPKVERYHRVSKLVKLRNEILVDMPYQRHTKRHIKLLDVDYDEELMERVVKQRWHVFEERPLRDVAEMFSVMRKVANSHSSRLSTVERLSHTHPRMIVFYSFDYELEALRGLARGGSTTGSTSAVPHELSSTSQRTKKGVWSAESAGLLLPSQSSTSVLDGTRQSSDRSCTNATGTSSDSSTPNKKSSSSTLTETLPSGSKSLGQSLQSITSPSTSTSTPISGSEPIQIAEWNGHKHEEIPTTDRWIYLVQYVAGAEGWNCVSTDTVVFYSLTYSYKNFEQAQGRIDRLNTPYTDLRYYVLRSKSVIDTAILRALSTKQTFNESAFMKRSGMNRTF